MTDTRTSREALADSLECLVNARRASKSKEDIARAEYHLAIWAKENAEKVLDALREADAPSAGDGTQPQVRDDVDHGERIAAQVRRFIEGGLWGTDEVDLALMINAALASR